MKSSDKKKGTTLLYELIAQAKNYPDTIDLGRGDLDFHTPIEIVDATREAMHSHANDYTPPEGILPLRQAIADRVKRINNIDVDPETEVVVTNGGQEALFLMVATVLSPGDELVVPDPNYNTYKDAINFARAVKVGVPTYPEENFRVDPNRVRQALTDRSRALLLTSPNNPTANVISPQDTESLTQIARDHDLVILADEIYDLFLYDDYERLSPASLCYGKERTLTLNAVSKAYAMTGWRIGWITGPADLIAQVRQLKAAINGSTSIMSQYGALTALTSSQQEMERMRAAYVRRRKIVIDALSEMGISVGAPQGGQFVFADIGFTGMDSVELAERILREQRVMVYPGAGFADGSENYLRITFLQPEELLREGLDRMKVTMNSIVASAR